MKELDKLPDPHVDIPNDDPPNPADLKPKLAKMRTVIAAERKRMGHNAFDEGVKNFQHQSFRKGMKTDSQLLRILANSDEERVRREARWYQAMLNEMTQRGLADAVDALTANYPPAMKSPPGPKILENIIVPEPVVDPSQPIDIANDKFPMVGDCVSPKDRALTGILSSQIGDPPFVVAQTELGMAVLVAEKNYRPDMDTRILAQMIRAGQIPSVGMQFKDLLIEER